MMKLYRNLLYAVHCIYMQLFCQLQIATLVIFLTSNYLSKHYH